LGTFGLLALNQDSGNLPTRNFSHARVESTEFEETVDHRAVKGQIYYSLADVLSLCMFVFGPGNLFSFDEITDLVNATTGLNLTFSDLMQLGERSVQLQRELYVATGGEDEEFPEFLETEIPAGPSQGQRITRSDFEKARAHYYDLWNWHKSGTQPAPE
jgi:aldehyde:ferredoxin oxidoreductase